jgi:hypothetical protein
MNREFVTFTHREATIRVSTRWRKTVEDSVRRNRFSLNVHRAGAHFLHSLVRSDWADPPRSRYGCIGLAVVGVGNAAVAGGTQMGRRGVLPQRVRPNGRRAGGH